MTLLGLDFDNTLVRYDKLFHELALEKKLINQSIAVDKIAIRDFLRDQGKDEEFTLLQGEVYGQKIIRAEPANGMLKTLHELNRRGIKTVIVSHKTKMPYKGPKYDLHEAAWNWLEHHGFFDVNKLHWERTQVFFEETKHDKLKRIHKTRCTHFIDDLPEIIKMLPEGVRGILYAEGEESTPLDRNILRKWEHLVEHGEKFFNA